MAAFFRPLIALVLALAALSAVAPGDASAVKFGAWTPGSPFGGNISTVNQLEQRIQRRVKIVNWFQDWNVDAHHFKYNVKRAVRSIRRSGRIPMLTWEPYVPGPWESYSNATIANGTYDRYIRFWARGLKRLNRPIYVRLAHEFNGGWYPWGGVVNSNSPATFKRMWRHVVTVSRGVGAKNIRWVWSPIADETPGQPRFERYWPGKRYVSVTGLSGFNWGASVPEYGGWRSFRQIFAKPVRRIAKLSRKPIWITEIGSASDGGSKHEWVRNMFRVAKKWDRLKAIVWYDQDKERDWSTASASAAFAD